jgi:hypothetical protein
MKEWYKYIRILIYITNIDKTKRFDKTSNRVWAIRYVVFEFSQTIPYSRACVMYNDFLDIAQLLMQALLKQSYVAPRLKSSLQKLCCHRYEISISQMTMDLLLLMYFFCLSSNTYDTCIELDYIYMSNMAWVL